MPVNKNANIRYRTLDRCFRDTRKRYFIEDLIDECNEALLSYNFEGGVKRRQIFDDIKFMESDAGYSIELDKLRDGKKVYYRYADPTFSINQQPLSQAEAKQLQQAVSTLTRFRGLPQYEWIEEVITNLEHRFNLNGKSQGIVCFEQNPLLMGLEHLGTLIDAATAHQVLKINYHTYKNGGRDMDFIIHPYYLKQYNNRWFLFGRNDETGQITVNALDRIKGLEPMSDIAYIATNIDFDHYFDTIVGVTIPDDPAVETIVFRTTEKRYPYIASKPLHPSQRIVDRKQCILQIEVAPNFELEQKLLSFGADIEVLAPEALREQIKKKVEDAYKKYFAVQKECTSKI
ncbi:MAG: WYL domain-containing protein [Muribaculaceae bacterium]|nr:WYL domain-containing protein [Muribaculaceae bacterium]